MHIENFKIFSDLVESQSFSRAAKLNGVTQSAVSQQLRAMEKHFNVLIVDRSQKQFRLTREGEQLFDHSREILYRYEKLVAELQEMRKVVSGSIQLSTVYSIGLHELPPYLKSFMQEFPDVNVHVEYRRSNMVYEDVLHNSVDLGLVAFPSAIRQLEIIPFQEDRLVLICPPSHPFAKRRLVGLQELVGQPFIAFDADIPTRKAIDVVFREAGLDIEPVMEFDNIETVKRAVEIASGIAIIPQTTIQNEVRQGLLCAVQIKGKPINRPLAIVYRRGRVLTPAMKRFIATLTGKQFTGEDASTSELSPTETQNGASLPA
jgi:LysR family transcriptional regulator, transcriptional activator of the cysJI operon